MNSQSLPYATDPILSAGADYWAGKCGANQIPARQDIDVLDMPREIIPHIVLAEFLSPAGVVRYRVVGGEMVTRFGFNFAGKTSREIFSGTYRTFIEDTFALTYKSRRPVYSESTFRWDADGFARTHRLFMPLSSQGGEPTHIFILQTWPSAPKGDTGALPRRMIVDVDPNQTHRRIVSPIEGRTARTGNAGEDPT